VRIGEDQIGRDDAGLDALLGAVNVLQKGVDGRDALFEAALQILPLTRADDARHHVEGDQALIGFHIAIDGEGHPHATEEQLGLTRTGFQQIGRRILQPPGQGPVAGTDLTGSAFA
jgi:hypothetical protein